MNELHEDAVDDARNAAAIARPTLSWALTSAGLCMLLALLGAVSSYSIPLIGRLAFWGGLFAVAFLIAIALEATLIRAGLRRSPLWRWWGVFTLVLAMVMTPVAYIANSLGGWAPLSMLVPHFGNSLVISAAFVGVRIGVGQMLHKKPSATPAAARPALMDRLPVALREARLEAIEAEGHYVRVHTDRGSEMVLMRLKDAIRETGPVQGEQVHRGWWVARSALTGRRQASGKRILLVGTRQVPVGRSRVETLREAGWFE